VEPGAFDYGGDYTPDLVPEVSRREWFGHATGLLPDVRAGVAVRARVRAMRVAAAGMAVRGAMGSAVGQKK
jgi:hypothetical protein